MANPQKKLHKFTDQNQNSIYVDVFSIISLQEVPHQYHNSLSIGTHNPNDYMKDAKTIIGISGYQFYVMEHIAEVIALCEGRDPRPAQVMFGSSKKD